MSKVLSMSDPMAFVQEMANGRSDVSKKYAGDGEGDDVWYYDEHSTPPRSLLSSRAQGGAFLETAATVTSSQRRQRIQERAGLGTKFNPVAAFASAVG